MSEVSGLAEPRGRDKGPSLEAGSAVRAVPPPRGSQAPDRAELRIAYLDGLRALAAGYVVMFHALPGFSDRDLVGPFRVLRRAFAYGHEAVAIFIVLSGYCLMLPVVRHRPDTLSVELGRFFKRRALRILPPYFAALAGSIALIASVPALRATSGTIWDDSLPGLDAMAILTHLLLVHNWSPTWGYQLNGPLWSVASEWQIYFFFPLVLLPVWRRLGMPVTLVVAALIGYAPLLFVPSQAMVAIPWYLLLFGLGMAAAAVGFSTDELAAALRKLRWGRVCAGLWLACFVFSMFFAEIWFGYKALADLLVGLCAATLLVHLTERACRLEPGVLLRVLESRPLVALGHFSYSLYLTHLPVLALCYFLLQPLGLPPITGALTLLVLGSTLSLAVAYAFHLMVERPFLLKR